MTYAYLSFGNLPLFCLIGSHPMSMICQINNLYSFSTCPFLSITQMTARA